MSTRRSAATFRAPLPLPALGGARALPHHPFRLHEHDAPLHFGTSMFAGNVQGVLYALVVIGCLWAMAALKGVPASEPYMVLGAVAALLGFIALRGFNLLTPWRFGHRDALGTRLLLTWGSVVGILLFLAYATKYSSFFSRQVLLLWFVTTPAALFLLNGGTRWLTRYALPELAPGRKAVMVFANDTARRFAENVRRSQTFDLVGYFEDQEAARSGDVEGLALLGSTAQAARYIREHNVPVVFIFLSYFDSQRAAALLEALGDTTASVYYVPDFNVFDQIETRMISVESLPMLEVVETPFYGVDGLVKQVFDSTLALLALTVLAIPLAIVALLIKLGSEGPVLFRQQRYGLNGREFWIYKFRTMVVNAPEADARQATRDDPRVTPIGRFLRRSSIDELPQLLNVLTGDMSLVGPRPHTVAHNELYRKAVRRYMVRHKVKPGLTGLAQVEGYRGETARLELMEKRIWWDLEYIKNWSITLDLMIILRTIGVILRGDNAY